MLFNKKIDLDFKIKNMNDYKYNDIWFEDTRKISNKQDKKKWPNQIILSELEDIICYNNLKNYRDINIEQKSEEYIVFDFEDIVKYNFSKKSYKITLPLWDYFFRYGMDQICTQNSIQLTPYINSRTLKIVFAWCSEEDVIPPDVCYFQESQSGIDELSGLYEHLSEFCLRRMIHHGNFVDEGYSDF